MRQAKVIYPDAEDESGKIAFKEKRQSTFSVNWEILYVLRSADQNRIQ